MRVENYQDPRPLHVATILEEVDLVWPFQEAPADLSKPEPVCSLHLAVEVHAADLLEILLRAGSDPAVAMSVAVCHGAAPLSGPTPSSPASSAHTEPLSPRTRAASLAPAAVATATVTVGMRV